MKSDVTVLAEDQERIGDFSWCTVQYMSTRAEARVVQETLQGYKDAEDELDLALEGECMLRTAEIFVEEKDEAYMAQWLQAGKEKLHERLEELNTKLDEISRNMKQKQALLYRKFGRDNINLELPELKD